MTPFPSVPKDLVEHLDALFSHKAMSPSVKDTDREIWIKVGKRELVNLLLQTRKDQETGADEGLPNVFRQSSPGTGPSDPGPGPVAGPGSSPAGPFASPQDRLGGFSE